MTHSGLKFRFGLEHEVAFLRPDDQYADWTNTTFGELNRIIDELPLFDSDYPMLRVGDLGIKKKRWYIEGYERYGEDGAFTYCQPKGIEIRTSIHDSIDSAVAELRESMAELAAVAAKYGLKPAWVSYNPVRASFEPDPPLNGFERARRASSPEKQTAEIPMMTQGPDLNLSWEGFTAESAIDAGRKLTFYSPYVIPFTFSSPFHSGKLWGGLSYRTFRRTGARPAAMVFLANPADLIKSSPSLTKPARVDAEGGRVEFKAADCCQDFDVYGALLALLKGLILDTTLSGRSLTPDAALHQHSATTGFADPAIRDQAHAILEASARALGNDPDVTKLGLLRNVLDSGRSPAQPLIDAFNELGDVEKALAAVSRTY